MLIFSLINVILFLGGFMSLKDEFKLLVGGYYGVCYLDEYDLKVYILKEIEEYIKSFIETNPIDSYDYRENAIAFESCLSMKTKLQDALIVLHRIKAPMDVVLLVKKRIKKIEDMEKLERM